MDSREPGDRRKKKDKHDETVVLDDLDLVEVAAGTSAAVPAPVDAGWSERVVVPPGPKAPPPRPKAGPSPGPGPSPKPIPRPTPSPRPSPSPSTSASTSTSTSPTPTPPAALRSSDDERFAREAEALAAPLPTRAALLHSFQARLALDLFGDAGGARASAAHAAALAPDARFVAHTRRWLAEVTGAPTDVVAACRDEILLGGDAAERAALLWQIAGVAMQSSGASGAELAVRALGEIVALDPQDLAAHIALAALATVAGAGAGAADAWEAAASRTDDPVARAAFHVASATARESRVTFERALDADATSAAALSALETLHLRAEAWSDHARLLVLEADSIGELDPALGLHERAGDVLWECLGDVPAAARCYERAAALSPDDLVPVGKLAALYEQDGRSGELARVYELLAGRLSDPTRKAGVLLRLGALYESRLDRPDDARRAYADALAACPTLAPAAHALAAHDEARGRHAELADLLLLEADRLTDPVQRAARYVAIAEQREVHLGADERVVDLLERALALDPTQAAAHDGLDRLYRAAQRWDAVIELHERQLAAARQPRRTRMLRLALASLYQERAGAPDRAAAQLAAALADPQGGGDDLPIVAALARALAEAGKWPEHVGVLERMATMMGDDPEATTILQRTATVVDARLGDPGRALSLYERVLERAPRNHLALLAIIRLKRSQARWEDVVAAERRLLAITERGEEAAAILYRIGQVAEEHLARPDQAIDAYREALERLPSFRLVRVGLERLLRARGAFADLARLLEEQAAVVTDPVDRARLVCQAALHRELHPGEGRDARARDLYEEVLSLRPGMASALWGLWRIGERTGDAALAASALERLAAVASHPVARSRLLVRVARAHELGTGDRARGAAALEQALADDPRPAVVFERLRAACATGPEELVAWLERAAGVTQSARLASGLLRLRAAQVEHGGGGGARAADAYAAALRHGGDPQSLDGLARNLARAGGGAQMAAAVGARARQVRDAATRALLLAVAGALHEAAGSATEADACYGEALAAAPDFLPALTGQKRLRERTGDWAAAAELAAQMGAGARDRQNQVEMYEEAAELAADRLGDTGAAARHYRAVLAAAPGHRRALARALDILQESGEWADAVAVLTGQVDAVPDDAARAELLGLRARLRAERLGDAGGAIADLDRAVGLAPGATDLLDLLARLHEGAGHWADAAVAHAKLAAAATEPAARRAALLAQARIWTEEVPDFARAQAILEEAVGLTTRVSHPGKLPSSDLPGALDGADRDALEQLADVAQRAGATDRAADLQARLARSGPARARVASFLALAELRRGLQQGGAADAAIRAAFDLAVQDPEAGGALEERMRAAGELYAFAAAAEAALERAPSAAGALPLRLSLATMIGGQLGDAARARGHLEAAARSHPNEVAPRIRLAAALLPTDELAAVAELRRVLELDPTEPSAYAGLAAVCDRRGWQTPAALMASAAELCGGEPVAADVRLLLASSPRPVAASLPPADALELLVGRTRSTSVRAITVELDPYLHEIAPEGAELAGTLSPLADSSPVAATARAIAAALAAPPIDLLRGDRGDPLLLLAETRALAIRTSHETSEALGATAFEIAAALARVAGGSALGALEADRTRALLMVASDPDLDDAAHRDLKKRIDKALPRRARKELERTAREVGVIDASAWAVWHQEEEARARRVALLVTRDLRAAARALQPDALASGAAERRQLIAADAAILDCLRFAATDACWVLARRVHGA